METLGDVPRGVPDVRSTRSTRVPTRAVFQLVDNQPKQTTKQRPNMKDDLGHRRVSCQTLAGYYLAVRLCPKSLHFDLCKVSHEKNVTYHRVGVDPL